jgi:hypothetical protein
MCLPDFEQFKQVEESEALLGYRTWKNFYKNDSNLMSSNKNYIWKPKVEGPHLVKDNNSGLYAYNHNNYYNNNYYNNNYNYYYDNYDNNYYHIAGIILQFGKVAIHKTGQRSEYAKIKSLFAIRKHDAVGSKEFLNWIDIFNNHINLIAKQWDANTIHWQDYK